MNITRFIQYLNKTKGWNLQGAYYAMDHVLRTKLPMENTFYKKKK